MIARREDHLQQIQDEIIKNYPNLSCEYILFNFSETQQGITKLVEAIERITSGNVSIFVHMAGNSDLSKHFTDVSLERNLYIMKLQVESTLILLQNIIELICKARPATSRTAILTSGALSAHFSIPGFAAASANKAYIRNLTLAAGFEFRQRFDIMCAHPIAVESEILRSSIPFSISADKFARFTLNQLGYQKETNGCILHDFFVWIINEVDVHFVQFLFDHFIPYFSKLLQRPVDLRNLNEKI